MFKLSGIYICCCVLLLVVKECIGQQKYKYRGCYEFHPKSSLVNDFMDHFEKTLTPKLCVDTCVKQNFAFAGLDNYDCRCGHHVPTDILKRSDSECRSLCPGNRTATCGGKSKVSVYETGVKITQFIPSRIYLGCFKDANPEFRVLKGSATSFEDNSPGKCHRHCHDTGFKYFGLTYIKECFCGDTAPALSTVLAESECDTRCSGDASQFCGGGWKLSLYGTGITDMSETGRFVGCYKNFRNSEIKPEITIELTKSNSNRRCLNICQGRGFKFSGIQDKTKCVCMNSIPPLVFIDEESSCSKDECVGEITETCGSQDRVKIFRTRHGDLLRDREPTRIGCYQDQSEYRALDGTQVMAVEQLTPSLCIDICKNKGYAFAGVEFGKECHCGHTYPTPYTSVKETECRTPCSGSANTYCGGISKISVYDTGLPHLQARVNKWYMGCYKDDNKDDRMLKGSWQELQNNSPDVCHKLCLKTGFLYFGLTWIKECFCGDENPAEDLKVPETECSKECGGDSTKKCGGGWRLSVYRTGLPELIGGVTYTGCFSNDGSLVADYKQILTTANKPKRCANICDQLGYLYAGVERGSECRCGFKQPPHQQLVDDSNCNIPCPGEASETCGGNNHVKIYRTTVREEVTTVTYADSVTGNNCKASNTSKNGKSVCKTEKLFEEPFNTLMNSTWKHTVKMAPEPDLEFVTYSSSKKVTFVKKGILFIKPQVQTEDYVYGKDTLNDCTGTPESDECSRERQGFNILPPVLSGQITTERSFSFRYGRVNIKAKLPTGDWIVPQIWLSPKDSIYGPEYESGQIRIAMARGNKDLTCDGKKLGNTVLETGIYFGLPNAVQHLTFTKEVPEGWSQTFHDYSLIWSPDNLSFYVDGKVVSSILQNPSVDTIGNVTKSPDDLKHLWQQGSRLAPFDKEFYITLGVSVGGITDFADSCTSNGVKIPWSNGSPKAMYNFWLKSSEWNSTWIGDNSALQVDHIKVEAL